MVVCLVALLFFLLLGDILNRKNAQVAVVCDVGSGLVDAARSTQEAQEIRGADGRKLEQDDVDAEQSR